MRLPCSTIWEDRALRRAFEVFGGVPSVSLEEANAVLSEPATRRLREATIPPAKRSGAAAASV